MNDIPIHVCTLPECKIYADLTSVSNDLNLVIDITEKLIVGETDVVLLRALFSGSLITYRRCFTSGVRNGLKRDDLTSIPGKAVEMHDYLFEQANRLIAHSVSPFEHTQVGALVREDKCVGITTLSAQLVLFPESHLDQWHRLSKVISETIL